MKKNIQSAAPAQVAAVENRDLFLTFVRESLRSYILAVIFLIQFLRTPLGKLIDALTS